MINLGIDTHEILGCIRSGKSDRDKVITRLYGDQQLRSKIESIILKHGGQQSDFNLIFNNTLLQFVKTVVKNKSLEINSSLHAYLCGIARYSWLNEIKKESKHRAEDIDEQYDISTNVTPETLVIDQGKKELLSDLLQKMGKNCKEVLMHWANGYSMKEIAQMMDYKSDMMAKKKKYKCFKQLLEYLDANPKIKKTLR